MIITGKSIGRKKPLFDDWSIPPPQGWDGGDGGGNSLADLIEHIVRQEVQAFRQRQYDRQFLRALTAAEIDAAAERGKIEMGGSEVPLQTINDDDAVATALQAFEDGMYLVVIDEVEYRDLQQPVYLSDDSRIVFIRLTFLTGV